MAPKKPTVTEPPPKRFRIDEKGAAVASASSETAVPAPVEQVLYSVAGDGALVSPQGTSTVAGDGALVSPQGASAAVVEQDAPPFGMESPETHPRVPSHDATPTPTEVQQLIKKVAANVIVTLHTFFEKHSDKLTELGISVVDTPTHPWQSQALPLPKEDSALDHTVSQLRPNRVCLVICDDAVWCILVGWWLG